MVRAIMLGCNGAMGQLITYLIAEDPGIELVAGVDINTEQKNGYPVFASLAECDVEADVVIDFASAKATDALLAAMVEKKLPGVLCSTGLSEEQLRRTCMVATVPEYQVPSYLGEGKFAVSKICEVPMVVRVDKGHPFARRQSVTRAEVARERIVCFNEPVVEEIVHHLLDEYGEPDFAFKGSIRNLLGRFPEAVLISGGYSPQGPSENVVTVPIRDTIQVHVVAITANPAPPLVVGIVECIARAYR